MFLFYLVSVAFANIINQSRSIFNCKTIANQTNETNVTEFEKNSNILNYAFKVEKMRKEAEALFVCQK